MRCFSILRAAALAAMSVVLLAESNLAQAAPLTLGDVLVSDEVFSGPGRIREFTPTGQLVQTFTFPSNPPGDGQPRDLVVDSNGNIDVYNGTFHPVLTTINPVTSQVLANTGYPGWSTVNNVTYGGVAAFNKYVFGTDMDTANDGNPNGLIRFNVSNPNSITGQRFGSNPSGQPNGFGDFIQTTLGKNGLLYAEYPGTSPGGEHLAVFNPTTLGVINPDINLNTDLRDIAVGNNGTIYAVDYNSNELYEFNSSGSLLKTLTVSGVNGIDDINLNNQGQIVAASGGTLIFTDTSLSSYRTINVGQTSFVTFSAWVEPPAVPEPSSLTLLGLGISGLAAHGWRRRKQPV